MEASGKQTSFQDPRELDRIKKRMIKLTNNTPFPYDAKSYDQTRWTYPTIIENYKDKAHIPPLELVYAGIKKTLTNIKKDSFCVRCAMKVGECNSQGLYFPLDKGIYLIPIPCCEGCFSRVPAVLVNGQICPIRHYTWKMIVCANLAEHYHKKVLAEAEKVLTEEEKPMIETHSQEEDPIFNHIPGFTTYDFASDDFLQPFGDLRSPKKVEVTSFDPQSQASSDYQWMDLQEETPLISFDTRKMDAEIKTKTPSSKIRMEWILSSILGPITCYIFYHLFHLFMHKNE